jgi:two-component system chemotaxis response regulator CheB
MMVTRQLIRVLVIDDSAFSRQTITRMLQTSPLVEVVGSARDGEEALRKTIELKPDLVTLDLEMPRMDGFTFLRLIMAKRPTPVMVISGRAGEEDVFKALDLGAVDFLAKPTPRATPELQTIQQELIRKVHAIRELRIDKVQDRIKTAPPVLCRSRSPLASVPPVVVVGSSTGGPAALMQTFGAFTEAPPCAFLVAQHMPQGFTRGFAERLDRLTPFHVKEAEGGEEPTRGSVLVAPGGYHLELEAVRGRILSRITRQTAADKYTPSVDKLFESAAKHFGSDLLAVVLTGMGDDGRRGACTVKECGGTVIAESEETAVIYGMPQQAVRSGAVDLVLPLNEIPTAILSGVADDQKQERRSRGSG